uniref:SAM domain-containing protein n=1 Tax=Steinernema glaseri TaxID=37863 RepID=A0A1I7YL75_9BILA
MPLQTVYHVVSQKTIAFWSVSDVENFLKRRRPKLALKYADDFVRHYITGRVLMEITDEDLKMIGVESFEERQDLLLEIRRTKLFCDFDELQKLNQNDENNK